jgi:group I intron endonuclease
MNEVGIYKIVNIINKKVYIGSSEDIEFRWKQHIILLRNRKHNNVRLQRAWDTYGEEAFAFKIIKRVQVKSLLKVEQYYINKFESYNPKFGYNISRIAGRASGWHHTEEARKKIGEAGKGRLISEKVREACRLLFLGKKHSRLTKRKLRDAWKRRKVRGDIPFWTGKKRSVATNLKISKKLKGRKIPKSAIKKWVTSRKRNGPWHSEETRQKISKSNKGKKISKISRLKSSISHKRFYARLRRLKAKEE